MAYPKVGQSIFPRDHYAFWYDCPTTKHLNIDIGDPTSDVRFIHEADMIAGQPHVGF
jgi:hypothetical protein